MKDLSCHIQLVHVVTAAAALSAGPCVQVSADKRLDTGSVLTFTRLTCVDTITVMSCPSWAVGGCAFQGWVYLDVGVVCWVLHVFICGKSNSVVLLPWSVRLVRRSLGWSWAFVCCLKPSDLVGSVYAALVYLSKC